MFVINHPMNLQLIFLYYFFPIRRNVFRFRKQFFFVVGDFKPKHVPYFAKKIFSGYYNQSIFVIKWKSNTIIVAKDHFCMNLSHAISIGIGVETKPHDNSCFWGDKESIFNFGLCVNKVAV